MEFPEFYFEDKQICLQSNSFQNDESNEREERISNQQYSQFYSSNSQSDEDQSDQSHNHNDLVCKDYQLVPIKLKRWKTVKPFEFFQIQCDCFFDIEYFEQADNQEYWIGRIDPIFKIRPVGKIIRYDQFCSYVLDTTITGMTELNMPIQRLYDTQNQSAYQLAKILENHASQFSQINEMNARLKKIFTVDYLKEKLDANFEKSYEMALQITRELIQAGDNYFVILLIRVCPETMTYKLCMLMQTYELGKVVCDNPELLYRLALNQCMPYLFDVQSVITMCKNMLNDFARFHVNLYTFDQECLPCEIQVQKKILSSCEISQGIFLPDICVIQKFKINPKIIQSIEERRLQNPDKYLYIDQQNRPDKEIEIKQKYYQNESDSSNPSK